MASAKSSGVRAGFTTYMTGIVHGLQPDALYVVIPALALPTKLAAMCYITAFVMGTCMSMGAYTLLIGEGHGQFSRLSQSSQGWGASKRLAWD